MNIITPLRARKAASTAAKLADFPNYTDTETKYREIKERRRALEIQISAVERGIYESVGGDAEELDARARNILAGGEGARRQKTLQEARESVGAMRDELTVLLRAEALQRDALREARHAASLEIVEAFAPKHREAVSKAIAAADALQAALRDEAAIREQVSATGAEQLLPDMGLIPHALTEFLARARNYAASR